MVDVVEVVDVDVVEVVDVEVVDVVVVVVGGGSHPFTQNTLCFTSAPWEPWACTVSLTWWPCWGCGATPAKLRVYVLVASRSPAPPAASPPMNVLSWASTWLRP